MANGIFIVIDGIDGSGKKTQCDLLEQRLAQKGYQVRTCDFPQYGKPSAHMVERYLNGELGPKEQLDPKVVSKYYAEDRHAAAPFIRTWLMSGVIVLSNRYTSSNAGHQTIRYGTRHEQEKYLKWLFKYEYQKLGIPKPDLTVILDVEPGIAQDNVAKKEMREYLKGAKMDIHERDRDHLQKAEQIYRYLASKYDDWRLVECSISSGMKPVEEIERLVWDVVQPYLPSIHHPL